MPVSETLPGNRRVLSSYVDGQFVGEGRRFQDINPVDGSVVADVLEADESLVDSAARAARRALHEAWSGYSVKDRAAALRAIAERIDDRFDEFVAAEVADTGKDVAHARTIDIPRAAENFRFFADLISTAAGESFVTPLKDGAAAINYTIRRPLGVVAVISPWNLPLLLLTWKVAPALACGNTVIAKPSEYTPFTATLLAEVTQEAGLPPGVFNLLHGFGANSAGELLTSHREVDAVTFTGETSTGAAILRAVASGVKPVSFELGGKNAALVFADCDFDDAVAGVARSAFSNCGQVCLCTERVFVERSLFDRFVAALKERAERLVIGRPHDPSVSMGPLISRDHRKKVLSYFDLAVRDGATVITGGGTPQFGDERDNGAFIQPTIWTGLPDTARCVTEEIFGPVCHVAPFDDEAEVIERANNARYGLACSIWTRDLKRAHRVAPQIESGIVWVNAWFLRDLRTPFGGMKLSGIGREGGNHSLAFYSEPTNICIKY